MQTGKESDPRIEYEWLDDHTGLRRRYVGDISMQEVVKSTLELHDHPRFESLRFIIEDHSQATNVPFSTENMKGFTNFVRLRASTRDMLRVALVNRDTPESIATANAFCEYMRKSHYECQAFVDFSEAYAWCRAGQNGLTVAL